MGTTVTVTLDSFLLGSQQEPANAYRITPIPAADTEFGAAVRAAVGAIDPDELDPITEIARRVRVDFPATLLAQRDPIAGYGTTSVWYAFRDGRPPRARRRVLVVDDDPSMTDVMTATIDGDRFDLRFAPDGVSALDAIVGWAPDLILLDLHMPGMSGDEFAARYRQLPGSRAPLVVLSSAFDASDRADRMEARTIVKKPFDLAVLAALLERYA